ncbi:MAG: glycosyltransferase [Clostridia bacterium]|nr:glycosyltransferase [Clostridia bacterium]
MNKNKRQYNIAVIHTSLTAGGVEKVLVNLLNAFDYSLFNVDLYLFKKDDFFINQINENVNINFEYNKTHKERLTLREMVFKFKIISALKVYFFSFLSLFYKNEYKRKYIILKGYPKISKKKYNAVICYNGVSRTLLTNVIFNFNAKKRIAWIHGSGFQRITPDYYSFFDHFYCVSQGVKKDFISHLPVLSSKTSVFYNLLNKKEILTKANMPLNERSKEFFILTVSRLSEEKGVMLIPSIAEKLKNQKYSFRWILIGDGPLNNALHISIKSKKLDDELIMTGNLQNPYNYMKCCDLYVQPSFTEGYCTTTNEAKLLCKPIIVTNVNGMDEQFTNGETAVIVDKTDVDALFIAIKRLIDDSNFRFSLVKNLNKDNQIDRNNDLASLFSYLIK